MSRLATLSASLLDLVFPRACPACNRTLTPAEETWCEPCTAKLLKATAAPYCPRCGLPVGPYLASTDGCQTCRDHRTYLDGFARVGAYRGILRSLIHKYKFRRGEHLDKPLARYLAARIQGQPWAGDLDALVPVPTTWRNRLRYRFPPATQLSRCLSRELSLPTLPLIRIVGKKRDQVGLPADERIRNVRGVFGVHPRARVSGTKLCIIDDVSTSGATIREVARALRKAGAASVCAAVIAKTEPGQSDGDSESSGTL
jgi:ComF family protein